MCSCLLPWAGLRATCLVEKRSGPSFSTDLLVSSAGSPADLDRIGFGLRYPGDSHSMICYVLNKAVPITDTWSGWF